jgi:hypothetical protein
VHYLFHQLLATAFSPSFAAQSYVAPHLQLNATYTGLKRVLVGAGIALKITGAQKVYFTHPRSIGLLSNGSLLATNKDLNRILPLSHPTCAPLLHVSVVGSVLMVAHEADV